MASFPEKVVLPDPCKPDINITVGFPERLRPTVSPPINSVSSSFTSLTINCPGFNDVNTFCPMALSLTVWVKFLAILKLTSASKRALRTSFSVSATFTSVILPCPFNT